MGDEAMRGREFGKPGVREAVILRLGATGECAVFAAMTNHVDAAKIRAIERPERALWHYYLLSSLVVGPFFPIAATAGYFRYHTMRYRFTDEGISMRWGILFRREIIIQYARIQDIHLRSNVVERWLGLGRILVQTASGSAGAEMTLEGLKNFEEVRDFLYARMRGVTDAVLPDGRVLQDGRRRSGEAGAGGGGEAAEVAATLREVAAELRAWREEMARARGSEGGGR